MAVKEGFLGRFYEDFEVGDVYIHPGGRTVTQTDNTWFTLLTCNTHPVHFDLNYAKETEFGKPLVNSAFTVSVIGGMSVPDTSQNSVANLGWDDIKLPNPVFAGDTLYADSVVVAKRESKSRPYAGIVTIKTRGYKQDGSTVCEYVRTFMPYKRDHAPGNKLSEFRRQTAESRPDEA